ncbi:MAG: TetR/AcrR family transcriptional regulator [Bdellovibrionales bacterium]
MVTPKSATDSKQALLDASLEVFAEKGLEGSTVKDIADAAGVNVALISYYFGSKDGLYKAALASSGQTRLDAADRVLKPVDSPEELKIRLKLFLEEFIHCHYQNTCVMKIIHRDFDGQHPIALESFRGIFQDMYVKVTGFIEDAKSKGIMRADVDAGCFVSVLFGGLIHSLRMDFLRKEFIGTSFTDPKFANLFIDQFIRNLCEGSFPRSTT